MYIELSIARLHLIFVHNSSFSLRQLQCSEQRYRPQRDYLENGFDMSRQTLRLANIEEAYHKPEDMEKLARGASWPEKYWTVPCQ